jgi:hypothetical protein
LRYVRNGKRASHVPDLLVWRTDKPELCDVKSSERVDDPTFQLLTEATAEAVDAGTERITHKLLDGIDVGYAAEVGAGRQQPQRAAA